MTYGSSKGTNHGEGEDGKLAAANVSVFHSQGSCVIPYQLQPGKGFMDVAMASKQNMHNF